MSDELRPFQDDRSTSVGRLRVENAADRVVIYGDIEIRLDRAGLDAATRLKHLVDAIVTELAGTVDLPDQLANRQLGKLPNPFERRVHDQDR